MKLFRPLFFFALRLRARHGLAMLCLAAGGFYSLPAQADGCFLLGSTAVDFGAISPDRPTDSRGTISLACQGSAAPSYVRYCVYLPDGAPLPGINPRLMTNYNGAQMRYDLYADPALQNIIGPPPAGGGFPVYTDTLFVPGGYTQVTANIPVYGRVPAGQSLPAAHAFESQIASVVTWSLRPNSYPLACNGGPLTRSETTALRVQATVASGCRITLATDLDFGSAASLAVKHEQPSTIMVRCPLSIRWTMGLDDGINASSGARRMRNGSQYVGYELYKDPNHMQRWGNAGSELASGVGAGELNPSTSTVYGRVPAQATAPPGTYSDTVTVTLTY
jgi:spore coat protein U-like protein